MNAFALTILLHYSDHDTDPAHLKGGQRWKDTIDDLFKHELLTDDTSEKQRTFQLAERGKVFVAEGLLNRRLPEFYWRMPPTEATNAHES